MTLHPKLHNGPATAIGATDDHLLESPPPKTVEDEILERVKLGLLSTREAEAEAARLGLPPFELRPDPSKFDPMKEGYWDFPMTQVWFMTGSPDWVRRVWNKYRAGFRYWEPNQLPPNAMLGDPQELLAKATVVKGCMLKRLGPVTSGDLNMMATELRYRGIPLVMGPEEAMREICRKAELGDLKATGLPLEVGDRKHMRGDEWRGLVAMDKPAPFTVGYLFRSGGYVEVLFHVAEVTANHPQTPASASVGVATCLSNGNVEARSLTGPVPLGEAIIAADRAEFPNGPPKGMRVKERCRRVRERMKKDSGIPSVDDKTLRRYGICKPR